MSETLETIITEVVGLPRGTARVTLRPPLDYQSNRLYDAWAGDRHLIVKEFLKPEEFHDAPLREFRALELLAPLDIAPQPVFYRPPAASLAPIVVYEYMEGQMWDRHRPTGGELAQLAELWLRMNAVSAEEPWLSRGHDRSFEEIEASFRARFRAYADWVASEFASGRQAVDRVFSLLESREDVARELIGYDPPLCFCRADPRFANVIRRPDARLGLVDWEDSGLRDPARDLADIITHPNQEDLLAPDHWQAFLQPYLAVRGNSDRHLQRRMELYLAVFPVFWLLLLVGEGVRRAGTGELAGWNVHGLPASEKVRRYLARALAWPELDFTNQMEASAGVEFFPVV